MKNKNLNFNYIFFFFWLLFTGSFLISSINYVHSYKIIFFFHGFSQITIEIMIISSILLFFEKFFGKKGLYFASSLLLIFLIMRYIDFMMLILMDNSIFYAINMIFGNGFSFILTNLQAANLNSKMLSLIFVAAVAIPFFSIFLFSSSNRLSRKKTIIATFKKYLSILVAAFLITIFFDFLIHSKLDDDSYLQYRKNLPYSTRLCFFNKKTSLKSEDRLTLDEKIYTEKSFDKELSKKIRTAEQSNNIFLFIIESLRKDVITSKIAPTLSKLKNNNVSFQYSFANANNTHSSWFSIFYSLYPTNWPYYHSNFNNGSSNLKILKKVGYDIHVLSSADLDYYNMDETLFGKNLSLLKSHQFYKDKKAWKRDANAFKQLQKLTKNKKNNNLFITFLDSTHSEYECPSNYDIKFKPVIESINYLKLCYSPYSIQKIKNRYKNAVYYLDELFSEFFAFLQKENLYDDAIIIITGDHGEEFFEEGSFFHGTHLNKYQINIPTIYKLPVNRKSDLSHFIQKNSFAVNDKITSLVDLFPTIFDLIKINHFPSKYFDGKSVFSNGDNKTKYKCVSVSNNGPLKPNRLAIFNGKTKYIVIQDNEIENNYIVESKSDLFQDKY